MTPRNVRVLGLVVGAILVAACQDAREPTGLEQSPSAQPSVGQLPAQAQQRAAWFNRVAPEVLDLPQTVYADDDETTGQLVFGIENSGRARAVQAILARHGVPASAYRIQVTEPIHLVATLQDEHRPTMGGIQIHFPGFLCTLGFNVTHAGGRSFITNSHCTENQGGVDDTPYWQPLSSVNSTVIADEVADPTYFTGSGCSAGKRCRYSDASRALYRTGTTSSQGEIARTTGPNNQSITVDGSFFITEQNNNGTTFNGSLNKVGRTTGWGQGNVVATCATVNVSGTDIQQLCQTLVQKRGRKLVGPGDSGSPVFQIISGDNVRLVGILWGGSGSGDLFVFSPLKNIQDELGSLTATFVGDPPDDGGGGDDPPPCVPKGPNGKNCK